MQLHNQSLHQHQLFDFSPTGKVIVAKSLVDVRTREKESVASQLLVLTANLGQWLRTYVPHAAAGIEHANRIRRWEKIAAKAS